MRVKNYKGVEVADNILNMSKHMLTTLNVVLSTLWLSWIYENYNLFFSMSGDLTNLNHDGGDHEDDIFF